MTLEVCDFSPQHGHGGVDLTHGVSVCLHRAVPAQLDYAVDTLRHSEKKKHGGNIQAQCGGEETVKVSGL